MYAPTVILSHGLESSPFSTKIARLSALAKKAGFNTLAVDYRDTRDPLLRGERLFRLVAQERCPPILVGSSMGAAISLAVGSRSQVAGLFLMAPAVGLKQYPEFPIDPKTGIIAIMAAWGDELIPPENIFALAQKTRADLFFVDSDHRLSDKHADLEIFFEQFLNKVKAAIP